MKKLLLAITILYSNLNASFVIIQPPGGAAVPTRSANRQCTVCIDPHTFRYRYHSVDDFLAMPCCKANVCRVAVNGVIDGHIDNRASILSMLCPAGCGQAMTANQLRGLNINADRIDRLLNAIPNLEELLNNTELSRQRSQPCPTCKHPIEKNGGCPHMTCGACRHQFCWSCLGNWRAGFGHSGSCNTKNYRYPNLTRAQINFLERHDNRKKMLFTIGMVVATYGLYKYLQKEDEDNIKKNGIKSKTNEIEKK